MKKNLKKILCLILTAAMLSFPALTVGAADIKTGDVNGDGQITVSDARTVLRIAIGLEQSVNPAAEDADLDGKVTVTDARAVLRAAIGLEKLGAKLSSSELYKKAEEFTVEIGTEGPGFTATGTGFFISADGAIATNFHVIENAVKIEVTDADGTVYECTEVTAFDRDADVAVIRVDCEGHPFAELSENYGTGDKIYTLGSSLGLSFTFSDGMISNAKRQIEDYNPGMYYIQITAPISSGNSGGPLLDEKGFVIGINTLSLEDGQNLNFSVPVSYVNGLDKTSPMTAREFYAMNEHGVYASALVLKELCLEHGIVGSVEGINYCEISSGGYDLTYYYEYDMLSVACQRQETSLRSGTTAYYDELFFEDDGKHDAYVTVSKKGAGLFASYTDILSAEYVVDGSVFTANAPVDFANCEKDDSVTDESAYERKSGEAVTMMVEFLKTVISAYKLDITVAGLGFKNF